MLQGISNTIGSLPLASIGCTTAGLYIGRKWCAAAAYKVGSIGANLVASSKAEEWNQASAEYLKIAKNDGIRDLAAATGLIAMGLASGRSQEKALPKEEPGYIQKYGVPAGVTFIGGSIGGSIGWILKRNQVFKAFEDSKVPVTLKNGDISNRVDRNIFLAKI